MQVTSSATGTVRVLPVTTIHFEDRGWTRGHATLSFDDVPKTAPGYLEYGALRLAVIEEIDGGAGYPKHPHVDAETIMIPLSGTIVHEDEANGRSITGPEDVSVLSAGTGIVHAESAPGPRSSRVMMFWLDSAPKGAPPRFVKKTFPREERRNRIVALASSEKSRGALDLRSDATIYAAVLDAGVSVTHVVARGRRVYLLAADAALEVNGRMAGAGDRVLLEGPGTMSIRALGSTEIAFVDLAG